MERIEIKTSLTQADWAAYQTLGARRLLGDQKKHQLIGMLLGALVVVATVLLGKYVGRPLSLLSLIAGIVLCAVTSLYPMFRARRAAREDPKGYVLGPYTIVFSATGVETIKTAARAQYAWSIVQDLEWTEKYLILWFGPIAGLIVPLRDLPPSLTEAQLGEELRVLRSAPGGDAAELPPLAPAEPPAQAITPPASSSCKRFMRAYGWLLIGRIPAADDLTISSKLALLLPAFGLALWLIVDRWLAGADAEFWPDAVLTWSWYALILLASVWAASGLARPRVSYGRVFVLTAAFVPVFLLLTLARDFWVRYDWAFVTSLAIAIYALVYVARVLRSLTGQSQSRAIRALAVILVAAVVVTHYGEFSGSFWYPAEDSEDNSNFWAARASYEALMYAQPRRIDAAVSALQRPADLPAAAFFVGFAGQGDQRVFAGEIALARKVIAARFGSAQRSVLLVNDERDMDRLPLASLTALRHALKGVAAHMKLDSDVLFLSLSSHGSPEGELSVRDGFLPLNDLSAADLATALRESGIKWKVIIVSACYAGKFVEPLREDSTIVIAAAAADRTSFGCSDDRDLTYFGEAFYRDALPAVPDLQAAFDKASEAIAAREQAEKITASNPTAYFGTSLVEYLRTAFPGD